MMELWPFTNFHDLNLDWLIGKWKQLEDNLDDIHASMDAAADSASAAAGSAGLALVYRGDAKDFRDEAQGFANDAQDSADSIAGVVNQVNTNTGRIDNLIATAGDGTVPSELTDIRVGWDGTTYTTAGEAVRTEVENVQDNIWYLGYSSVKFTQPNGSQHSSTSDNIVIDIPANTWYILDVNCSTQDPYWQIYEIDANNTSTTQSKRFHGTGRMLYKTAAATSKIGLYAGSQTNDYTVTAAVVILGEKLDQLARTVFETDGIANYLGTPDTSAITWTRGIIKSDGTIDSGEGATTTIENATAVYLTPGCRAVFAAFLNGTCLGKYNASGNFDTASGNWGYVTGFVNVGELIKKVGADTFRISILPMNEESITTANVEAYGNEHAFFITRNVEMLPQEQTIFKAVNHRGYNEVAPENTLPAYQLSRRKGFRYVETDVAFTSDNVAVLLHDDTLNRTARLDDGSALPSTVYIDQITYAQAVTYDMGIWKGPEYAGTRIPTLEEFTLLCKKLSLHPFVELKNNNFTSAQADIVESVIKSCGMGDDVTFISFIPTALQMMRERFPDAEMALAPPSNGYNTAGFNTLVSNIESLGGTVMASVSATSTTTALYTILRDAGIKSLVWTVDSPAALDSLDNSVAAVLTDNLRAGTILEYRNI